MSNDEIVNNDSNDTEKLSINIDSESFKAPYDFMNFHYLYLFIYRCYIVFNFKS